MANIPDTSGSAITQNPQQLQEPVQSPLAEVLPTGLQNPVILNQPAAGTPSADINAPVYRPGRVVQAQPPLHGPGVLSTLNAAGTNVIQMPLSLASSQQPNQANLINVVPFPVLSRRGNIVTAWAAPITIASLQSVTVRGAYRDLHMTPGWRGIQIQYPAAASGIVTIKCNFTGMIFKLPNPTTFLTAFVPLYMLREMFDLTISTAATAFGSTATALLVTEEQMPFIVNF